MHSCSTYVSNHTWREKAGSSGVDSQFKNPQNRQAYNGGPELSGKLLAATVAALVALVFLLCELQEMSCVPWSHKTASETILKAHK
jgi:hypothetical protein